MVYYDTIVSSNRFIPFLVQHHIQRNNNSGEPVVEGMVDLPGSVSRLSSDYVRRIKNCIILTEFHELDEEGDYRFRSSYHSRRGSMNYNVYIAGSNFIMNDGFIYHVESSKIVFLTAYDTYEDRYVGFVDREFDSPRVPVQLRNMRKHIRAGLAAGRAEGMAYKHVRPGFFTQFKMQFDYNGKTGLVSRAHADARYAISNIRW